MADTLGRMKQVAMLAVWRRQAGVSLLPVVLASMATVALQMAADTLHDITSDFAKEDRIVRCVGHLRLPVSNRAEGADTAAAGLDGGRVGPGCTP